MLFCSTRISVINYSLYPVPYSGGAASTTTAVKKNNGTRATERIKWPSRTPNDPFVNFGGVHFAYKMCVCVCTEFLMFRIRWWLLWGNIVQECYLLQNFRTTKTRRLSAFSIAGALALTAAGLWVWLEDNSLSFIYQGSMGA